MAIWMPVMMTMMRINSFKGYLKFLAPPPRDKGLLKILMILHILATKGEKVMTSARGTSQKRRWQRTGLGFPTHMRAETKPMMSPTRVIIKRGHVEE